jgi:hypothetical protein
MNSTTKPLALFALLMLVSTRILAFCGPPMPEGTIVLTVPPGGAVTSLSTDYDCAAGQTCSFVVPNAPFSETFTAAPAAGYKFTGWKTVDLTSLCPDETGNCVVNLSMGWTVIANRKLEPVFDEIETLDLLPADTRGVLQVYPGEAGAVDLSSPGTPWAQGPLQILEQQSAGMDIAGNAARVVLAQMSADPNEFLLLAELDTVDVDTLSAGAGLVNPRFHLGYPLWEIGATGLELAKIDTHTLAIGSAATVDNALDSYVGVKDDIDRGPLGPYIGALELGPVWPNSLVYGLPALYGATTAPGSGAFSLSQTLAVNSVFSHTGGTLAGPLNFFGDNAVSYHDKMSEQLAGYPMPSMLSFGNIVSIGLTGLSPEDDLLPLLKTLVIEMDGVDYAAEVIHGGNPPFLNFLVGENPNSIFINFEFKDQQARDDFEAAHLPQGFSLAPLRIIEDETPRYYLVLNVYQSSGNLVSGARAEWSVFVNDPYTGEPRFLVIQAAADSITADSVNLLVLTPDAITHELSPTAIETCYDVPDCTAPGATPGFASTIDWPQSPETRMTFDRQFVVANDYIFWGNGVADRGLYNSSVFNREGVLVDPAQFSVTDNTEWSAFVNASPVHTLVYLNPLDIVVSPWWNLDEPYLDPIIEAPGASPSYTDLVNFKNGFYPNLIKGEAQSAIRGEWVALASTYISDSVPTARYHFPLLDAVGLLTGVAGPGVHTPAAIGLFDGETPGHYLTLNVYKRESDACGIRAEWVTYVEGADGRADSLRVDTIASQPCLDPVSLMTLTAAVDQSYDGVDTLDTVIDTPFIQFDATVDLSLATGAQVGLDWLESGDLVCSVNGVCDKVYIEGQQLMEEAQLAGTAAVTIHAMATPWDSYIDTGAVRAGVRLVPALQALNPWRTMRSFAAPAPLP